MQVKNKAGRPGGHPDIQLKFRLLVCLVFILPSAILLPTLPFQEFGILLSTVLGLLPSLKLIELGLLFFPLLERLEFGLFGFGFRSRLRCFSVCYSRFLCFCVAFMLATIGTVDGECTLFLRKNSWTFGNFVVGVIVERLAAASGDANQDKNEK